MRVASCPAVPESSRAFGPLPVVVDAVTRAPASCRQQSSQTGCGIAHLQDAYQDIGGLVTGDALSVLLREQCDQPISLLARWIVDRRVVSFEDKGQRWLPMFQFDSETLFARHGVEQVIGELIGVYDECELALWFATPSIWLDNVRPATVVARDPAAVLDAARADRFVARG